MNTNKISFIKGINPLRCIAAFGIILYHSSIGLTDKFPDFLKLLLKNLPVCVDFFFIISGFLIVYLLLNEKERKGNISVKNFYVRRALRILPLYYLILGVAIILGYKYNVVGYILFLGNFSMIDAAAWPNPIITPLWSINVEEHFYLFIPLAIALLSHRKLICFLIAVILSSIVLRYWAFQFGDQSWYFFYCHSLSRFDVISIGCLIGLIHHKVNIELYLNKLVLPVVLLVLCLVLGTVDISFYDGLFDATFKKYLAILLIAFLFILIVFNKNEGLFIKQIKGNRVLNYIGKISFGLYMYHMVIIELIAKIDVLEDLHLVKIPLVFICTIILSILSFELFEKQLLKFKKGFQ